MNDVKILAAAPPCGDNLVLVAIERTTLALFAVEDLAAGPAPASGARREFYPLVRPKGPGPNPDCAMDRRDICRRLMDIFRLKLAGRDRIEGADLVQLGREVNGLRHRIARCGVRGRDRDDAAPDDEPEGDF